MKTKETVISIWANQNADSFILEFVLRGDETREQLNKLIEFVTSSKGVIKTAEWFIDKELVSKSYGGKLKYKDEKPPKGTIYLDKYIK